MKKLLNDPDAFVDEMIEGLCEATPSLRLHDEDRRVICRASRPEGAKVGVVSGGGSGHLPLFTGYVGRGLLDSCSIGNVFAGPTLQSCVNAMRAANTGRGVLRLYGNYGGDRMNFDLAGELLADENVTSTTVLGTDDIASAPPEKAETRRGVAGLVYAYKTAGASAEFGADLDEVTRIAQETVDRTRTIGCAMTACQLPGAKQPAFVLAEDEIEMGMGIHGEPGIWRDKLRPADEIADDMLTRLLAEVPSKADGRVSVLVNSLGSTSLEELYIVYRSVSRILREAGYGVVSSLVGRYATSMEMGGISISLLHLDDEILRLLESPADSPFFRVG